MSFAISAPVIRYEDIATDVANMSQEDQDAVFGDLYGERPVIAEDEEMIQSALLELDVCIESIHPREAYESAQVICPEYANSRDFRLMFLRCERYDCKKAAQKIVNYWDRKVEVWGEEKAYRRLTLDDFDEEDQTALTMGGLTILPERDDAGRCILFSHRALWDNRRTHRNSMLRLLWYVLETALENLNTQRNGMVLILHNGIPSFDHMKHDGKLVRKFLFTVQHCLPIHFVATHQIAPTRLLKLTIDHGLYWLGPAWRARYRVHSGKRDEYVDSLAAYGIQHRILPGVLGGELAFDFYDQWLQDRRAQGK